IPISVRLTARRGTSATAGTIPATAVRDETRDHDRASGLHEEAGGVLGAEVLAAVRPVRREDRRANHQSRSDVSEGESGAPAWRVGTAVRRPRRALHGATRGTVHCDRAPSRSFKCDTRVATARGDGNVV